MAGYSGTPLVRKLGIRPGMRLHIAGAPDGYEAALALPPDLVRVALGRSGRGDVDFIHVFTRSVAEVERTVKQALVHLAPAGMLWVSWVKKSSPRFSGLGENDVRRVALAHGLVDVKVCAVDDDWSGLKLVRRRADR